MRYLTAGVGGVLVCIAVAMALLFFVGNAVEGLPPVARYTAIAACCGIALLAGAGSARATLLRSRRP
jgi:hypothetical protein